jgi:uncharacterized membrane protein
MAVVERSGLINVPPEKVWEAYMDLPGWLAWNRHMREVKALSEGPLAVGSRARIVLKTGLRSQWEVTELTPGESFTWVSNVAPGVRVSFGHTVEPADGGSRATYRVEAGGPLGALAFPVLQGFYSRNLDHSLANLKAILEASSGGEKSASS